VRDKPEAAYDYAELFSTLTGDASATSGGSAPL